MRTSEKIETLTKALFNVHGKLENAKRDSDNPYYKSRYASLESIINYIKPILKDEGLLITQGARGNNDETLTVITRVSHLSGEWQETDFTIGILKHDPQAYMSSTTYGRRGALLAYFNMGAEDDDGNTASGKKPEPKKEAPRNDTADKVTAKFAPPQTKAEIKAYLPSGIAEFFRSHEYNLNQVRDFCQKRDWNIELIQKDLEGLV